MGKFLPVIIAILIIVLCAWRGTKRNPLKTIISIGITVAAALAAVAFSESLAQNAYDNYMKEEIVTAISDGLDDTSITETVKENITDMYDIDISDADVERLSGCKDIAAEISAIAKEKGKSVSIDEVNDKIDKVLTTENITEFTGDAVPEELVDELVVNLRENRDDFTEVVQVACSGDNAETAKVLEKNILRSKFIGLLRCAAALVIFIVVTLVLKIALGILSVAKLLPVGKQLSKMTGFVLGLAEGVVIVVALGVLTGFIGGDTADMLFKLSEVKI